MKKLKSKWIKSSTSDKKYFVREMLDGTWACSCPHFVFRGKECKHIKKVIIDYEEIAKKNRK